MSASATDHEQDAPGARAQGDARPPSPPLGPRTGAPPTWRARWRSSPAGTAAAVLVLTVPAMVIEEGWHRRAMIDTGWWWVPFALFVPAVFVLGGVRAGSAHRRPMAAATAGLICGEIAIGVLVGADAIRRYLIVKEPMSMAVLALWFVAGAGAVLLSGVGGALGALGRARRDAAGRSGALVLSDA